MLGEKRNVSLFQAAPVEPAASPTVPQIPEPQPTPEAAPPVSPTAASAAPVEAPVVGNRSAVMNASDLFFTPSDEGREFGAVLRDVQEYVSKEYSSLLTKDDGEEAKAQIKRYIGKFVQDRRVAVKGMTASQLVDALYTEMAEFSFLTKYIGGEGIEEIDVNSWRDIEIQYAGGVTKKLTEHFDSPEHAINVVRRMLHVSGMVLDDASPAVLGHLSKNVRIAVLKTPLVDSDIGVCASIRIVNPQNMKQEDFVRGGTATGEMLDFLSECVRYGVSVCVASSVIWPG